jgi:hypothetical protein
MFKKNIIKKLSEVQETKEEEIIIQEEVKHKCFKSRYAIVCRYIKKNRPCVFGDSCHFAHHFSEL